MRSDLHNALLLFDKPVGWTSFDVVNKVRKLIKTKVGHAGTLDPLASGLLLLCTGGRCKSIEELKGLDKEYTGTLVLGSVTESYDLETPPMPSGPYDHLTESDLKQVINRTEELLWQLPPMYSAKYHKGKRLYQLARAGKEAERLPQQVMLHRAELLEVRLPEVRFRLVCSKGFYVRSWVHDLGQQLGCGAYLKALQRTRVGPYLLNDAWQITDFVNFVRGTAHDRTPSAGTAC
ncbi:MAG: tRNA pseudouridine(55) synthase TruB [Chitinophagales bacterium]|nr:tRNA pseudouridine(55) synthase TruB [Chitinophagales bacterium]MDW8392669.1 tRNA pseudouridine(55) synthase TruB [Chitinophagales bacterium]